MKPQTELLVASAFSLSVGFSVGLYLDWSQPAQAVPPPVKVVAPTPKPALQPCEGRAEGGYEYTSDWFNTDNRLESWNRYLKPLSEKPINYLEVGVYEGRSMIWMLENALTHPDSRATGIDLMIYSRYERNLLRSGACEKVTNLKGPSQDLLHTLPKSSFDVIYIDGSHLGQDVLVDAVLAFNLLKSGGMIVFDDYGWYPDWASDIRPGVAIDSFVTQYRHQLDIVHKDYQLIVRKKQHPCAFDKFRLTPVGPYCYHWVSGQLLNQSDKKSVKLLPGEKELISQIASSMPFGQIDPALDLFKSKPEFQAMNKRLKIFPL